MKRHIPVTEEQIDDGLYVRNPNLALTKARIEFLAKTRSVPEIARAYGIPYNTLHKRAYAGEEAWILKRDESDAEFAEQKKVYIKKIVEKELYQLDRAKHLTLDMVLASLEGMHAKGEPLTVKQMDFLTSMLERLDKTKRLTKGEATAIIGNRKIEITPDEVMSAVRELMEFDKDVMDDEQSPPTTH